MLPYRDSTVTRVAIAAFFVLALVYGYFELRGILYGPNIEVPSSVMEVHDSLVSIRGSAQRIAELRMNGKQIPVTEDGAFNEPYVLLPGYNRIVLEARDAYGRARERIIEIIYTPLPEEDATSTPPVAP
jgi:hypothetical protein